MENLFLAKTNPKETIIEHTEKLNEQYNKLKKLYPSIQYLNWDILKLACLYHDLGKMNTKFQMKLMNKLELECTLKDGLEDIEEIPHGYISPAFLPFDKLKKIYSEDELRILYQSIYYHHTREKLENNERLKLIIKQDISKYINDFNYDKVGPINELKASYTKYTTARRIPDENDSEDITYQYIITKGLLNKIDYAASSGVTVEEENKDLYDKTLGFLRKGGFEPNELQQYMIKNQNKNNVIIASTGIGKTEAALFWVGNNKGFFTLPLKVSINAIYDRIIDKIKFSKDMTGLLHSDTASEYLKRNEDELDLEYFDKTKQLSLPLTVCTLDQLIDFVFKYEGFELKLATLAYSKLIIDEIQMYSPELVAYLIVALKQITEAGGKFSILTATFPPVFEYFMKQLGIKYEKSEKPFYKMIYGKVMLRHKIKVLEEDINIESIKSNYHGKKVLVIVNTVKQAQKLYDELKKEIKDANINLFHSKFIKKDRAVKEADILEMGDLKNKDTGIWITTQVVEASLDIDFDVLYTELSDISGLLQRMGRVYRNRVLEDGTTNIYIYVGKEKNPSGIKDDKKSIIDYDIFTLSKEAITKYSNQELNEEEKMKLVEEVYSESNLKRTRYFNTMLNTINYIKDIKAYEIRKSEVYLRNIESETMIPRCIYLQNKDFIEANLNTIISSTDYNKKLIAKNAIKELTLTIPKYEYDYAKRKSLIALEAIELDKFNSIPIIKFDYSFEKGLSKPEENAMTFDEEEQFL